MLRGVYPERTAEILRFAQNDSERGQHESLRLACFTYLRQPALKPETRPLTPDTCSCSYASAVLRFLSSEHGLALAGPGEDRIS
jgi:hypothetical protein